MKKLIVFVGLIALSFASCSKSDLHPFGSHHSGSDDCSHHSSNSGSDDNPNNSNGDGDDD